MNKRLFVFLLLLSAALASCADTSQLYERDAFLGGTYVGHVYNVWEGSTKQGYQNIVHEKSLDHESKEFFCGSGVYADALHCYGYADALAQHPDWFKNDKGETLIWGYGDGGSDIINNGPGRWADNSPLYDIVFSQNKRLDRFYEKFSRGYLSKLYNGQIKCNGWSYYAMAVASNEGFGTMFPYELRSAEYFATSVLISTDNERDKFRVVDINLHVTFYKFGASGELQGYKVSLNDISLSCNAGAALTSFVGFTFADAGINPTGIVGMSYTWDLLHDPAGATADFDQEGNHDGLSVYETFFPDSSWF